MAQPLHEPSVSPSFITFPSVLHKFVCKSKIMNAKLLPLLFVGLAFTTSLTAQIKLKLQLMPNGESWGVYVKPDPGTNPTLNTTTGSGQITIVVPNGYQFDSITNVSGKWVNNATIIGPPENPTKTYRSLGLQQDQPHIDYLEGQETLLFIFHASMGCPDDVYLIDNDTDPFNDLPNSANSNPGNDLAVVDIGKQPIGFYYYDGNYALQSWDCNDCDNDGIPNALEDTNGDGEYTPGVDVSDLCGGVTCAAPEFIQQPSNKASCTSDAVIFSADVANDINLLLQWQVSTNGGADWEFLTDNTQYNGAFAEELLINFADGLNGNQYRLVAKDGTCETISTAAQLLVDGPFNVVTGLQNVMACNGGSASFQATITKGNSSIPITYQWDKMCGANDWEPVLNGGPSGYSGVNTNKLDIADVTGLETCWYRLNFSSAYCSGGTIGSVGIAITDGPEFETQPQSATVCEGSSICFNTSIANAATVEYQWQESSDGINWSNISDDAVYASFSTNELCVSNSNDLAGRQYRLEAQTNCGTIYSEVASLTTTPSQLSFVQQPVNDTICGDDTALFSVEVSTTDPGSLSYQWQMFTMGNGWLNINDPLATGVQSTELAVGNASSLIGMPIRLKVNNSCGEFFSNPVFAVPSVSAEIVSQPVNDTICNNEVAVFTINIESDDDNALSYQWQIYTDIWEDLSENFVFSGTQTNQFTINSANISSIFRFRAKVTGGCSELYSNEVSVFVSDPPEIAIQPADVAVCGDAEATLFTGISYDGIYPLSFQWQQSLDNGATWTDLADGQNGNNHFDGAKDVTLHIAETSGLHGSQYRMTTWNAGCGVYVSEAASLSQEGPIAFLTSPDDETACHNGAVQFSSSVENSGNGVLQYQWEMSSGDDVWSNVPNNATYTGGTTNNLAVNAVSGLYNFQYRLNTRTGACDWITSESARLTVQGPIEFELQPDDAAACPDSSLSFATKAQNFGQGAMQLQWQMSNDGGATWTNIYQNNSTGFGGTYTGAPSELLSISQATGLDKYQYRLKAATSECVEYSDAAELTEDESLCPPPPASVCLKMKLQYLPYLQGWGVFVKPNEDEYMPDFTQATNGRVTIVAPQGFNYSYLTNHAGGDWQPEVTYMSLPGVPGMMSITFKLKPNQNQLLLEPGKETMLFSFRKFDGCPDDLYLLDHAIENGPVASTFSGIGLGLGFGPDITFRACEIYDHNAWQCVPAYYLLENGAGNGNAQSVDQWFDVSPNPATNWVNIAFKQDLSNASKASLQIWTLQGSQLSNEKVQDFGKMKLDLSNIPTGVYMVALEVDGKVMQRERIVKH